MARLEFRGAAAKCTAHADIGSADLSIGMDGDVAGWPTGASGRNFMVILDRGTAKMEKILCSALTGTTLTVVSRGYDGTSAKTHNSGSGVEHGFGASVLDDYGAHVYDVTRNDHTQYLKKDGSVAFTGVTALVGTPVSVGTGNAGGSATTMARSDHVHDIADGAIDSAAKLADGIVNEDNLAASVAGGGITGGAGSPLALNVDGATIEIASDAAQIKDAGVGLAKLASGLAPVLIAADSAAVAALTGMAEGWIAYQADKDRYLMYDGSAWILHGWGAAAGRIGCKLSRVANQLITAGVAEDIAWDTENADTNAFHAGSSASIIVPTGLGGIYSIAAKATWAGAIPFRTSLAISAAGETYRVYNDNTLIHTGMAGSIQVPLAAGDVVLVSVFQNDSSDHNVTALVDVWWMHR